MSSPRIRSPEHNVVIIDFLNESSLFRILKLWVHAKLVREGVIEDYYDEYVSKKRVMKK